MTTRHAKIAIVACGSLAFGGSSERIRVNQVGYVAGQPKIAVSLDNASNGTLVDSATGSVVATITGGERTVWSQAGDTARIFDFSSHDVPGTYFLRIGSQESHPLRIARNPYLALARGSIKSFWFQRCSYAPSSPYAGVWAHAAGHPDLDVQVHASAASSSRPTGTKVRSPGGWYDAGDYGKYVVNSGISTWTLLHLYESDRSFFDTLSLDVPRHGGPASDLVDEILWNLRWMLTMRDPADGGTYHKLTTANFSGFVMPAQDVATRYVVMKTTAASLDLAATAAAAARIFKDEPRLPGFADSCRNAAISAWRWARASGCLFRPGRDEREVQSVHQYGRIRRQERRRRILLGGSRAVPSHPGGQLRDRRESRVPPRRRYDLEMAGRFGRRDPWLA